MSSPAKDADCRLLAEHAGLSGLPVHHHYLELQSARGCDLRRPVEDSSLDGTSAVRLGWF